MTIKYGIHCPCYVVRLFVSSRLLARSCATYSRSPSGNLRGPTKGVAAGMATGGVALLPHF